MTPASSQRAVTPRPVRAGMPSHRSRTPLAPRRVSGPVKRPNRPLTRQPNRQAAPREGTLRVRAAAAVAAYIRSLPDHRWLDRLVRGRAWIPLMGVLLAGIVATQVEVLKLGASMGRWVSRTAALTSRNQALQASVATLSDGQRIERLAGQMGMVMPAPTDVNFIPGRPAGGLRTALGRMHAPDPTTFLAALAASQASALAQAAPAVPPAPVTPAAAAATGVATAAPAAAPAPGATTVTPATTAPPTTTVPPATAAAPTTSTSPTGGVSQTGG